MSTLDFGETPEILNVSFMNSSTIINNTKDKGIQRDETIARIEVGVLASIFTLTILGNMCVLVALAVRRIKMARMYYFLLHLCISDLITAFFNILPQLAWDVTYRFYGGNILCKVIKYLQILGPYLSSYVLMVTAIDRYHAICFPLRNCVWTPRKSKLMIIAAWTISMLCCVPQVFIFSYQKVLIEPITFDCWGVFIQPWGEKVYVLWYALSQFFIPLIVITFTCVRICKNVWYNFHLRGKNSRPQTCNDVVDEHNRRSYRFKGRGQVEVCLDAEANMTKYDQQNYNGPRSHSMRGLSRAKVKTVRITVVVIACYIICSTPFIVVQLWAYWSPYAQTSPIWKGPTVAILMLLASLNSCVNPWIYLAFNHNLVTALKHICCHERSQGYSPQVPVENINNTTSRSSQTDNEICTSYPLSLRCGVHYTSSFRLKKTKITGCRPCPNIQDLHDEAETFSA
ncbi:isotocin receptor-like [Limulus polyphemus]|uniref:Isotocin receptor-like n=1 Tax=Limulus polyphemus TaxID=6850 RepID=A0ABM1S7M4_LIMPO|nr:isotocin receptor-like [Limulus polyphemus]